MSQVPFDDRLPYTIHFLDSHTQHVNGGDPGNHLNAYRIGPGQHVYGTAGMPTPPAGQGN
jgi:hypothetical protein